MSQTTEEPLTYLFSGFTHQILRFSEPIYAKELSSKLVSTKFLMGSTGFIWVRLGSTYSNTWFVGTRARDRFANPTPGLANPCYIVVNVLSLQLFQPPPILYLELFQPPPRLRLHLVQPPPRLCLPKIYFRLFHL